MIKSHCLIVLDGEINKKLILKYSSPGKRFQIPSDSRFRGNDKRTLTQPIFISADGASNKLYKWKIIPDYIIGDLDSITPKAIAFFRKQKAAVKRIAEQEHNDFEKCIKLALSKKIKNITVLGYGGKRSDHFMNNFSVLKKYYKKCNIRLVDNNFEIFFAGRKTEFNCKTGETVSLMAIPKAEGITTYGLKYPLKNETLEFGVREGTLNHAVKNKVRIEFKKGDLLVFRETHL